MTNEASRLAGRVERISRSIVWETPLEKTAIANGLYETILGAADQPRPAGVKCYGLGVARTQMGTLTVEAYLHGHGSAKLAFRRYLARAMGLDIRQVAPVPSWGFTPYLGAGEAGAHGALAAIGGFGTVGGFAADLHSQLVLAVSNNHVFANNNQGVRNEELVNAAGEVFGGLYRYAPLLPQPDLNFLDGATGWVYEGQALDDWGIRGVRCSPPIGLRVRKLGAASGETYGRIVATSVTAVIDYGALGWLNFARCLAIVGDGGPFSVPGDSGSLVLDERGAVVGIIFAGDEINGHSLANPVEVLTSGLGISF